MEERLKKPSTKEESPCPQVFYHALDLSGYEYVSQNFHDGCVIFHVRPRWRIVECPVRKSFSNGNW